MDEESSWQPTDLEVVAEGLAFPEGPVALPDGSVLVVQIPLGTLDRVLPDGRVETVARCGGGPNGAAIGPDGACYVTNNGGVFDWHDVGGLVLPGQPPPAAWPGHGSIQRVDLATGEVEELYTECDGRPLRAPNDLVVDRHGGFWFTDHGARLERSSDRTGVYYARVDGSGIEEVAFPLDAPNGVGLSPGHDRLYVAETYAGRVWSWPVEGPGRLGRPGLTPPQGELLVGLPGEQYLDSLAVDGEGHVCVGTLLNGGITDIAPDGTATHVPLPDPLVTNIC